MWIAPSLPCFVRLTGKETISSCLLQGTLPLLFTIRCHFVLVSQRVNLWMMQDIQATIGLGQRHHLHITQQLQKLTAACSLYGTLCSSLNAFHLPPIILAMFSKPTSTFCPLVSDSNPSRLKILCRSSLKKML